MLGLIRKQYPEVALRRLMDLQDKYPSNPGIAAQIGVTEADLGHPEDALRYLGMASNLEPSNAQHMFNMAVIADRMGKTADAIKYYEQALRIDSVYGKGRTLPRDTVLDRLATLRSRM
jgi:tetratricopeptide (TPR) repeat protein